jgi:hypothetical protein
MYRFAIHAMTQVGAPVGSFAIDRGKLAGRAGGLPVWPGAFGVHVRKTRP